MGTILRTHNLTKRYEEKTAVNNVNMNIQSGEIYGFLGQNGSGKTTTMRMIMGLIHQILSPFSPCFPM
jgi:ABC-type multidrug transport system ATPase subunit